MERIARRSLTPSDQQRLLGENNDELRQWSEAFAAYQNSALARAIDLAWVHKPVGGNFGDWLSPYIVGKTSLRSVRHVDLAGQRTGRHVLSIGSIISRANARSIVMGSGINSLKDAISPYASFHMVRGHITREALPSSARSGEIPCCDPGFFMYKLYTPSQAGRTHEKLLVPHINHTQLLASLNQGEFNLLSARACRPSDLEALVDRLASAQQVITSAMHIFVICCAYGVRCALIQPRAADVPVPGDGIKYRDCMSPVLREDFYPTEIDINYGIDALKEVQTRRYDIDHAHIERSFKFFEGTLLEV
ncbi:hypothetical protein [Pelagerythrobacter aerophilus]